MSKRASGVSAGASVVLLLESVMASAVMSRGGVGGGIGGRDVAGFRFRSPDLRGDVDDKEQVCLAVGEQGLNWKGWWLSRRRVRNGKRGGFEGCNVRIHLAAHVAHLLARVERLGTGR